MPIYSKWAEYRFWENYGEIFFDTSLNGRHATNGATSSADDYDCIFSDRGLYFHNSQNYIRMPPNDINTQLEYLNDPINIIMWINIQTPGRIFFRVTQQTYINLKITPDLKIELFTSLSSTSECDNSAEYSASTEKLLRKWSLYGIEINSNQIKASLNNVLISNRYLNTSYIESGSFINFGVGSNNPGLESFKGFMWYLVISQDLISDFIDESRSSNCFSSSSCSCKPALVIDSIIGCVTSNVDVNVNSNSRDCKYSNCEGGIISECSCGFNSCLFNAKDYCKCSREVKTDVCVCEDGISCCNEGCLFCQGLDKCEICEDPYAVVGSDKRCYCKDGFFGRSPLMNGDSCEACSDGCGKCLNSTICTECLDPLKKSVNGVCLCKTGYFMNDSSLCESCESDCLNCESKTICFKCSDKNSENIEGKCVCKTGFWFSNITGDCQSCLSQCSLCEDLDSCTGCKDENSELSKNNLCICKKEYYLSNNSICEKCPNNCVDCMLINKENEVSCLDCSKGFELIEKFCDPICGLNEVLINHKCECSKNFTRKGSDCVFKYFFVECFSNQQNEIKIKFNKTLLYQFNTSSFDIETSNKYSSFELKQETQTDFSLYLKFSESVKAGSLLKLNIDPDLLSIDNEKLYKSKCTIKLIEFEYISQLFQTIIKNVEESTYSSNIISFSFSMFTNPSAGWVLLNSVRSIYFLPLSKTSLTPTAYSFCKAIGNSKSNFNLFTLFKISSKDDKIFEGAKKLGIESTFLWINLGSDLTILFIVILIYPALKFLKNIKKFSIDTKVLKILSLYKYAFFIRFYIQSSLIIGIYAFIGFETEINTKEVNILDVNYLINKIASYLLIVSFI